VFGDRGVGLLGLTYSSQNVDTKYKDLLKYSSPVPPASLDELIANSPVVFSDNSALNETTLKYDYTGLLIGWARKVQLGGAVKRIASRYDTQQPFGFDNPYSPTPGGNTIALDTTTASYDVSGYGQGSWQPAAWLSVTAGARVDRYGYTAQTRVSPRAGAGVRLSDRVSWQSSWGIYYQQTSPLLLAAFPGNNTIDPLRADHYVTGIVFRPDNSLRLTAEGYWKEYRDYPVASQFPEVTLANIGDTFDVRESLFPLTSQGKGRAVGVELALEKQFTDRWFAQANLAFSKTRHAGLDGVMRPGAFDYPFVANFVGGYRLTDRWELALRFAYLTGRPYTPYDETASAAQHRGIYDLARINGLRAADYLRIDIRADRTIIAGPNPLIVFAGVQNLTNRRNFAGYSWDRVNGKVRFDEQQGIFPLVGMEWRF
jgi:hypothetical protein